jgi:signal transduction histidine kinase
MLVTEPLSPSSYRYHRRAAIACALALAPFFLHDLSFPSPGRWLAVGARAVWVTAFLGLYLSARAEHETSTSFNTLLVGFVSGAATVAIAAATGGHNGTFFGYLYVIPFAVALLFPGSLYSVGLCTLAVLAGGTVTLLSEGLSLHETAVWASIVAVAGAAATWMSYVSRRLRLSEARAEQARAQATVALAQSEVRRERAERREAAGQLAGRVAHEVNSPLGAITANLAYLSEELMAGALTAGNEEAKQVLWESRASAKRIQQLVEDLKVFTAEPPSGPVRSDAGRAIAEALRLASALGAVDAQVQVTVNPELLAVKFDHARLVGILETLLRNSADSLAGQGSKAPGARGEVQVEAVAEGSLVRFTVRDTGAGFTPEGLAHVFEPFYTTKGTKGRGLGLAIAHEWVKAAGGTLEAANEPGGGARVTMQLPASAVG